jgi:hypothetical protein
MTRPHGLQLDLGMVGEPEDIWARLFLIWLKNLSEQNAMNQERLAAMENCLTQLDKAVAKLLPEESKDLRAAIEAIQDVHEHWEAQSSKSLARVEDIAVIIKTIIAKQKND